MPTPAPLTSQQATLDALLVRNPVSAIHGSRWAMQLAHLFARQVHRVCSHNPQYIQTRRNAIATCKVVYQRSRGARVARVIVEMQIDSTLVSGAINIARGYKALVTVTPPTGATWIDQGSLDGVKLCSLPSPYSSGNVTYEGWIDVTGCSVTAPSDMIVSIVGNGADTHAGLSTITLQESPLSYLSPETGEYGIAGSWPDPRNNLETGDGDGPVGFNSLIQLEQSAATELRWIWQIFGYEDAAPVVGGDTWFVTGNVIAAMDFRNRLGTTGNPTFRARARSHYGTATGMAATLRVRYYSANGGQIRLAITPRGGATVNTDLALGVSAAWTTASVALTLPASGTEQEFSVVITLKDNNAVGTTFISQVSLIQSETA